MHSLMMKSERFALQFTSEPTTDTTEVLVPAERHDIELLEGDGEFTSDSLYHAYMQELKRRRHDDEDAPLGHRHFINRSNWLRAAVLGANDGLVSVASLTIGMAGATDNKHTVLLTAVAALVAGALSMAAGEYVSVAAQREIEMADVDKERREQRKGPEARAKEFEEFVQIYIDRGLTPNLARQVAVQMCRHDLIRSHARDELGIDIDDYVNPWSAALASAVAFSIGATVPIIAVLLPFASQLGRTISITVAVTIALAASGTFGAMAGGAPIVKGTLRVLFGGWIAMAVTYGVGKMFGAQVS